MSVVVEIRTHDETSSVADLSSFFLCESEGLLSTPPDTQSTLVLVQTSRASASPCEWRGGSTHPENGEERGPPQRRGITHKFRSVAAVFRQNNKTTTTILCVLHHQVSHSCCVALPTNPPLPISCVTMLYVSNGTLHDRFRT